MSNQRRGLFAQAGGVVRETVGTELAGISRMRFCAFVCSAFLLGLPSQLIARDAMDRTGDAVVREMNLARQHPDIYANILEARRTSFHGHLFVLENGSLLRSREGTRCLDVAVSLLRHSHP